MDGHISVKFSSSVFCCWRGVLCVPFVLEIGIFHIHKKEKEKYKKMNRLNIITGRRSFQRKFSETKIKIFRSTGRKTNSRENNIITFSRSRNISLHVCTLRYQNQVCHFLSSFVLASCENNLK